MHRAAITADFDALTVIADDPWDFVAMWLRREHVPKAIVYWDQARSFYEAALSLPPRSSPLPAYYALLNAAKALLSVKKQAFGETHGVGSSGISGKATLNREIIKITNNGVLGGLRAFLEDGTDDRTHTLKDVLRNIAFVHRAYFLTFSSQAEFFVPISVPILYCKDRSEETWFAFELAGRYATQKTINTLGTKFERDAGLMNRCVVRLRDRFDWKSGKASTSSNLSRLATYHRKIRRYFQYIAGSSTLWYVKRSGALDLTWPTLVFAAMHRLSELARYDPSRFDRHLESRHNWLLTEFVRLAPRHFIDAIAAELTGHEILPPGIRSVRFGKH